MKPISVLLLFAIATPPALSQAEAAADKKLSGVTKPTSLSEVIPFACNTSNILITDQLAEIKHLQERNIPVTHDLAGYFYAVVKGRKLLGCPDLNPFSTQGNDSTSTSTQTLTKRSDSSEEAQITEILCKPARALKEEVMDQINVLKQYNISIPDYLAGWWSVTKDADGFLNCRFQNMEIGPVDNSTTAE